MPNYRSVSQVQQYDRCPHQYYLARIYKEDDQRVWQEPCAWLPQGTAFHLVCEEVEKSDRAMPIEEAFKVFDKEYWAEINKLLEETPNTDRWAKSGPYDGDHDIPRRYDIGLEQIEKFYAYNDAHPEETVWVAPDGVPAIETEFEVVIGDVEVRGKIDVIKQSPKWKDGPRPVDYKTGNKPGEIFQLKTYQRAMKISHGVDMEYGYFWMAKTGKMTFKKDLSEISDGQLEDIYGRADAGIRAEQFDPKPDEETCRRCSVRFACAFSAA